jgi:uncharacterized membrane protein
MPAPVTTGVALFLCWLFGAAAVHKLRSPDYYARLVSAYLPAPGVARAAVPVIALAEIGVALALLLPAFRALGFVAATAVLTGYALSMAWHYLSGRADLECGCSGPASALTVGPALILRNLVCAGLAGVLIFSGNGPLTVMGMALAGFVALFLVFIYLCTDQIIANAQAMAGDV